MDKLSVISGCLFLAADIFAIASVANPDWISTGDSAGGFVFTCELLLSWCAYSFICAAVCVSLSSTLSPAAAAAEPLSHLLLLLLLLLQECRFNWNTRVQAA